MTERTSHTPRFLVPLDGSRLAEAALPAAQSLATHLGARLLLLHVIERGAPPTIHGERHLARIPEASQYLEDIAVRLRGAGVEAEVHVHEVEEHDVARSISDHAVEHAADLVILSTHGSGGVRDFIFGSIAQQTLEHGTRPLLLVRPAASEMMPDFDPRRILVGLEGAGEREEAIETALRLAPPFGARLHLVIVVPTPATLPDEQAASGIFLPSTMKAVLALAEEGARDYMYRAAERCRSCGVEATTDVLRGDTVAEMAALAERLPADLIVVGAQGEAGLRGLLSGSPAKRITDRLGVPLWLVQSAGDAEP